MFRLRSRAGPKPDKFQLGPLFDMAMLLLGLPDLGALRRVLADPGPTIPPTRRTPCASRSRPGTGWRMLDSCPRLGLLAGDLVDEVTCCKANEAIVVTGSAGVVRTSTADGLIDEHRLDRLSGAARRGHVPFDEAPLSTSSTWCSSRQWGRGGCGLSIVRPVAGDAIGKARRPDGVRRPGPLEVWGLCTAQRRGTLGAVGGKYWTLCDDVVVVAGAVFHPAGRELLRWSGSGTDGADVGLNRRAVRRLQQVFDGSYVIEADDIGSGASRSERDYPPSPGFRLDRLQVRSVLEPRLLLVDLLLSRPSVTSGDAITTHGRLPRRPLACEVARPRRPSPSPLSGGGVVTACRISTWCLADDDGLEPGLPPADRRRRTQEAKAPLLEVECTVEHGQRRTRT